MVGNMAACWSERAVAVRVGSRNDKMAEKAAVGRAGEMAMKPAGERGGYMGGKMPDCWAGRVAGMRVGLRVG